MRATLLARTRELLARAGYFLSSDTGVRPLSFDLAARRDDELLLVKVLTNVDGLTDVVANELRVIAEFLNAAPLVVGERSSSRELEHGAVYLRYGVRIVTPDTLREYLEDGVEPLVFAAPGGFYVNLDGPRLRAIREERGLSLGDLAQAAGVSRRAIGMYEDGMGAMVEVAMRLEEFLDESLTRPTNPFKPGAPAPAPEPPAENDIATSGATGAISSPSASPDFGPGLEGAVLRRMSELGFRVAATQKSPFRAIGKDSGAQPNVILTGVVTQDADLAKRAAATADLCEVTETFGVFFVERTTTRLTLEGTPVVSREELRRVDDPEELLKLLTERRKKA